MKKSVFLLVIAFAIVFSACNTGNNNSETNNSGSTEVIKIGVILPLTGDLASYGVDAKRGIELAYLSLGRDTLKYKLIFENSKGQPSEAVKVINKLIEIDGVEFIIGDVLSNTSLAMAPIANQKEVFMVCPTASSSKIVIEGMYSISIFPSEITEGMVMANYVKKNNIKSVGVLYENVPAAEGMCNSFIQGYGVFGNVLFIDKYSSQTTDFKTIITKYKNQCRLVKLNS
jgi:branched-chain amino acid transport system substrate-binding protein